MHSDIRKFERLIWAFGNDSKYNRTSEAEWRHQADLQHRSRIQNDTSDEVGCILLWTMTRNLDTGETTFVKADSLEKI